MGGSGALYFLGLVDHFRDVDLMVAKNHAAAAQKAIEDEMGSDGRVLLRLSGTEPLVRIMLEGKDEKEILDSALKMAHIVVKNHGGKIKS